MIIYIYIYTYIHICALAKSSFCSGGKISCKPSNRAVLITSINKNDHIVKVLIIVHRLVPILKATMIMKVLVPDEYTSVIPSSNNSSVQSTIT